MADRTSSQPYKTERFKAFVDAVVAIAMTLLILPLMESVSEAGASKLTTLEFLDEHTGQLMSFLLSFFLIANFWMGHHRQYDEVTAITRPLLLCNVFWMATIVWLPVPTAMLGQMDTDPLQQVVYIGTLILTQVATLIARAYLLRHPELTTLLPIGSATAQPLTSPPSCCSGSPSGSASRSGPRATSPCCCSCSQGPWPGSWSGCGRARQVPPSRLVPTERMTRR